LLDTEGKDPPRIEVSIVGSEVKRYRNYRNVDLLVCIHRSDEPIYGKGKSMIITKDDEIATATGRSMGRRQTSGIICKLLNRKWSGTSFVFPTPRLSNIITACINKF
jgi:hypothetical protein